MGFPYVIDNTIRKALATCQTQAKYKHIDNIQPVGQVSIDLHFGRCFATGIEHARSDYFLLGRSPELAVQHGIDMAVFEWGTYQLSPDSKSYKTLGRLPAAIRYYFEQWPLGEDGLTPVEGGIECSFDFEIPIAHPDEDVGLRYAGRFDMLASDKNGRLYVVDEKTASRLGETWVSQWDLDAQMTGYIWGVQQQDIRLNGLGEMPEIMAQIRAISILSKEFGHVEIPIVRPQWVIDRWYAQMLRDVQRFKITYELSKLLGGTYDLALHSNACTSYNRDCDYKTLCMSPNPERLIAGNYQTVVWNPLVRKD